MMFTVIGGSAAVRSFIATQSARAWSNETEQRLALIHDLDLGIWTETTFQLFYLLSGDPADLARYQAASAQVGSVQRTLDERMANNPEQRGRLHGVMDLLAGYQASMAQAVQARRDVSLDAAASAAVKASSEHRQAQIEAALAAMVTAEQTLLTQHNTVAADRREWMRRLMLSSLTLAILALFWAARTLNLAAITDDVTGLLSRNRLWELLARDRRGRKHKPAAMLCVDIDRFRAVSQVHGPGIGDRLLAEIGKRLQGVAGAHPVGRLGSDDFAIYCSGVTANEAQDIGMVAAAAVAEPLVTDGRRFHLTASVGVAHTDTAGGVDLRLGAYDAMHAAKQDGGNRTVAFVKSMREQRQDQAELEAELHLALETEGQLTIDYQPIFRMSDRRLFAVEALARWQHPRLGSIPPERFIPLAEARDLIVPLGRKLMTIAVRQAAVWQARYPTACPVINLNISPIQFTKGNVVAELSALLRQHDLPPSVFCIEVTEGVFANPEAIRTLETARALGFKVAMDDLGVGYSSLSQLGRLPLQAVKLDRSFVLNSGQTHDDAAILAAMVQLGHALRLDVIAEGVENLDQLHMVAGCDAVQGYLMSKPLKPSALDRWLLHSSQTQQAELDEMATR
jgi:diguanylate cyclase (GGDEF)-like protein